MRAHPGARIRCVAEPRVTPNPAETSTEELKIVPRTSYKPGQRLSWKRIIHASPSSSEALLNAPRAT